MRLTSKASSTKRSPLRLIARGCRRCICLQNQVPFRQPMHCTSRGFCALRFLEVSRSPRIFRCNPLPTCPLPTFVRLALMMLQPPRLTTRFHGSRWPGAASNSACISPRPRSRLRSAVMLIALPATACQRCTCPVTKSPCCRRRSSLSSR